MSENAILNICGLTVSEVSNVSSAHSDTLKINFSEVVPQKFFDKFR